METKGNSLYLKYKNWVNQETNIIFCGRLATYKYYDMHRIIEKH